MRNTSTNTGINYSVLKFDHKYSIQLLVLSQGRVLASNVLEYMSDVGVPGSPPIVVQVSEITLPSGSGFIIGWNVSIT